MSKVINYRIFSDRIIGLIYGNNDFSYDKYFIEEEGNKLGKEIYNLGGENGLFSVMRIIEQELLDCEYSNEYLSVLRQIEWSWNGICQEWQA